MKIERTEEEEKEKEIRAAKIERGILNENIDVFFENYNYKYKRLKEIEEYSLNPYEVLEVISDLKEDIEEIENYANYAKSYYEDALNMENPNFWELCKPEKTDEV